MTNSQFFTQLGIVSLLAVCALFGLFQIPQIAPYQLFAWLSLLAFIILSVLMFVIGRQSALSENKNTFTSVILGFTMGKMFMAIMVIYVYLQIAEPSDKFFVAPFFTVYFIYTAFETYFMMKLGKTGV